MARKIKGFAKIRKHLAQGQEMIVLAYEFAKKQPNWQGVVRVRFKAQGYDPLFASIEMKVAQVFMGALPKSYFIARIMSEEKCSERHAKSMLYRYCRIMGYPLIRR